jgi:hypothetical protein
MHHYAMASGETIIQIHGMSPLQINNMNASDDPNKKKQEIRDQRSEVEHVSGARASVNSLGLGGRGAFLGNEDGAGDGDFVKLCEIALIYR